MTIPKDGGCVCGHRECDHGKYARSYDPLAACYYCECTGYEENEEEETEK